MFGGSGAQCGAHAEDCLSGLFLRGTRHLERTVGHDLYFTGRPTGKRKEILERVRGGAPRGTHGVGREGNG